MTPTNTHGRLLDRTAIVTGAGRGAGAETARMLAAEGASVVVNDLDAAEAEATVRAIRDAGGNAVALVGNVTDPTCPDRLVACAIDTWGGLDILVNNAGYIWNSALHNHSDAQWQAMLDVHATAPFRIARAWAPWLRETARREIAETGHARCRKVVNVSSVSGTLGSATQIGYASAKAAVIGLTKTLAKEWGRLNVTVNCVAFGHLATRLTQPYDDEPPIIEIEGRAHRVGLNQAQAEGARRATALQRSGTAADGAGAVFLLCLPESDFITGQVLSADGGL